MKAARADLDDMEKKIVRALPGAATMAARVMLKYAKGLVPSDTGRLRRNIAVEGGRRKGKYRAEAHVYVKRYAFYGAILESSKFARRQPFMGPALRASIRQMEKAIEDYIMHAVRVK